MLKLFKSIKENIKFILIAIYTIKLTTQFMLMVAFPTVAMMQEQTTVNVLQIIKSIILI